MQKDASELGGPLDYGRTSGVSVVIPVYESEEILPALVDQLRPVVGGCCPDYEIILVNDGSTDQSWAVIEALTDRHDEVRGIDLMRNYGQHNASLCGVRAARHPVVVTMDDDLQHSPEDIPRLLEKLDEGYDVVYGTPVKRTHRWWRALAAGVTKLTLQSVMGARTARSVSPFRAFRTSLRRAFADYSGPFVSIDVLLTWGTTRFGSVSVVHRERQAGRSTYTFRKLMAHALNMMTGFSTLPLQFASVVGFCFTLFGVAVLVYVVGRYLIEGGSVPGFPFLASIIAIFSGAQLFAIGIIGEYLARMHFRLMDRPTYAVRRDESESSETD